MSEHEGVTFEPRGLKESPEDDGKRSRDLHHAAEVTQETSVDSTV